MTEREEDERRKAEQFIAECESHIGPDAKKDTFWSFRALRTALNLIKNLIAGRDSMRAENKRLIQVCEQLNRDRNSTFSQSCINFKELEAERERSAKLIEYLKLNVTSEREYFEAKPHKALRVIDEVEAAIAEYESQSK